MLLTDRQQCSWSGVLASTTDSERYYHLRSTDRNLVFLWTPLLVYILSCCTDVCPRNKSILLWWLLWNSSLCVVPSSVVVEDSDVLIDQILWELTDYRRHFVRLVWCRWFHLVMLKCQPRNSAEMICIFIICQALNCAALASHGGSYFPYHCVSVCHVCRHSLWLVVKLLFWNEYFEKCCVGVGFHCAILHCIVRKCRYVQ